MLFLFCNLTYRSSKLLNVLKFDQTEEPSSTINSDSYERSRSGEPCLLTEKIGLFCCVF